MNKTEQNNLEGNINKICLMSFMDGMWFAGPIFIIFLLGKGMSFTQIGLLMGASYITSFLFDIPSSIWADKYSRKLLLVLSFVALTLCNLIIFFSNSFKMFFVAFCFSGIGNAFLTGIFSAFIYDTLLSQGKEKQYEKVQSRLLRYYFAGRILTALISVYLYKIDPRLPFLFSALADIACVMIILQLKEPIYEKSISKSWNQIKEGLGFLSNHKTVYNAVIVFSVVGAIWDVLYDYSQPVMEASGISIDYFGVIYLVGSIFGFLGASFYSRIRSRIDWKGFMLVYLLIDLAASIFFGAQITALVIISFALLTFSSGSFDIYIGSIVHKAVPSSHRATTLSIRSQMCMLFSLIFISAIGFVVDRSSIFVGMLVSAAIILIAMLVFLRVNYKKTGIGEQLVQE